MSTPGWVIESFDERTRSVVLVRADNGPIADPFLSQAAVRLRSRGAEVRTVPLAAALEIVPGPASVAGLVLHTGRCGSTLMSNLLRTDGDLWVVGEAPALNHALMGRLRGEIEAEEVLAVLGLCAVDPTGAGRPSVLKLTSWAAIAMSLLPAVPTVLMWAPADHVVARLTESGPGWFASMCTDPEIRRLLLPPGPHLESATAIAAAVWNQIVNRVLDAGPADVLSFDEAVFEPMASADRLRAAFGLSIIGETPERRMATTMDAKDPAGARFSGSSHSPLSPQDAAEVTEATSASRAALEQWSLDRRMPRPRPRGLT